MKILSFGHIPSWAGGRQNQGLSNVIYNLALNMSRLDNVRVYLGATDVFIPKIETEKLTILGWNKFQLLLYAVLHPLLSVKYFLQIRKKKRNAHNIVSMVGHFFKGLHLHRCLTMTNPDVVHLHGCISVLYLPIIPYKTKVIVTIHGTVGNDSKIKHYQEYQYFEKSLCQTEIVSSLYFIADDLKNEFIRTYGGIKCRTNVILNAYDANVFNYIEPISHDGIRLATIASIQPRKGQCRVLEALSMSNEPISYECMGTGSQEDIEHLRQYKYSFILHGQKTPKEIREILSTVDFMILPSSSEGFGLVYLESIACGVPVILPKNLPIVQEKGIIQPGVNAVLLESSSADSIAEILPKLKDLKFDHRKVAESIVDYSWDNIAKRYVESIKKILS